MAYYLVRLYTGSGDRPAEQLINEVIAREIVPKLQQAGGLQRYIAGVTDDGRLVSASVYDDKASADRGLEVARQFLAETGVMRGYQLQQSFGGQIVRTDQGDAFGQRSTHGVGRLYRTRATAEQVTDAIQQNRPDEVQQVTGRVRSLFVQLDDGRVASIAAFTSKEARNRHSDAVRRHRSQIPAIKAVLPEAAEEIMTVIHYQT